VNSEELELSLRTEFENHLRNVVADMRHEFFEFREKIEAEFDKHKSQLDGVFQEFSARLETERSLETGFTETVVEHLRLARDEGARLTATAFAEAEAMGKHSVAAEAEAATPPVAVSQLLRDAVKDITAQDSQATILKSLVQHAAQFTPRGAFFIVKNEQFVGWRVFGKEGEANEETVREVVFPVASATAPGEAIRSLNAVESSFGSYADDLVYLNKLEFGQPDRMYAIPLVARGRGVAVLYADFGTKGVEVNLEALETIVRVAGLTVEVLAAAPTARTSPQYQTVSGNYAESASDESREKFAESEAFEEYQAASDEPFEEAETTASEEFHAPPVSISGADSIVEAKTFSVQDNEYVNETEAKADLWSQPTVAEEVADEATYQPVASENGYSESQPGNYRFSETSDIVESPTEANEISQFETAPFAPFESSSVQADSSSNGKTEISNGAAFEPATSEPAVAATVAPVKSRFGDRNVDLPIEVGDDERRLHNDARRFARLLVSEIKLYNEQKVREGRQAQDLYERLREAIDRSRDMYDKRVQPPVAAKFDYFHYELVSSLAEGEEGKLGGNYPGATA
jgi:hypothetical protein